MIHITGDVHGTIDIQKLYKFNTNPFLTRDDYLIVCGDIGVCFRPDELEYMIELYSQFRYTVLFVDGNHENFDLLETFETEEWNGGLIRKISDNIFHLLRGQVFTIENKTIFTFGGAESVDKAFRVPYISWWPQENFSKSDFDIAYNNLEAHNFKVDYIITHCGDTQMFDKIFKGLRKFKTTDHNQIAQLTKQIKFKHWYFGHYHTDVTIKNKTCLYQKILQIGEKL